MPGHLDETPLTWTGWQNLADKNILEKRKINSSKFLCSVTQHEKTIGQFCLILADLDAHVWTALSYFQ